MSRTRTRQRLRQIEAILNRRLNAVQVSSLQITFRARDPYWRVTPWGFRTKGRYRDFHLTLYR